MKEKFSFAREFRARTIFRIFNILFMCMLLVIMLVPLLKIVSDSLDKSATYDINLIPKNFSIEAYIVIFTKQQLYIPFLISVTTTVSGTFIGLTLTTLGAYVLAKRDLVGRNFLAMFVFITMIFKGGIVPLFFVVKTIGLTNNLLAVILPTAINVFYMILMRNFFEQIPASLCESAEIDGASPMKVFIQIILPLSKAGLAAIGLFYTVQYWNSFFEYVMYISNYDLWNFQMKLREMILLEQNLTDPGIMGYAETVKSASVIIAMLPFIFLYPFAQRYFITGVTLGAIKE